MVQLSTGISALQSTQAVMDTIAQNIANANTPGYSRRTVTLATTTPNDRDGFQIGTGVKVAHINRIHDSIIRDAITENASDLGRADSLHQSLRFLETMFVAGDNSIQNKLNDFFDSMDSLAAKPEDPTRRSVFLQNASNLADEIRGIYESIQSLREKTELQLQDTVNQVNLRINEIARVSKDISASLQRGITPNDLLDRRDQLIHEVAELIDVRPIEQERGHMTLIMEGISTSTSAESFSVEVVRDESDQLQIGRGGVAFDIHGGRVGGMLDFINGSLDSYQDLIDQLASGLMDTMNGIHATGLSLKGELTTARSHDQIDDIAMALGQTNIGSQLQAGSIFVSVTDSAGDRTMHEVQLDPSTDSLQDLATSLSAVPGIQAVVDGNTQELIFLSSPGSSFDFAGRLQPTPDHTNITGSATVAVEGKYEGSQNETYTYSFLDSGAIGVTAGLMAEIQNSAGEVIGNVNVGEGYQPGSDLPLINGVAVQISPGQVNIGDSFSIDAIAEPDETGVLTALQVNGFFVGKDASDIKVRSELLSDQLSLATSLSGEPGDAGNVRAMIDIRDTQLFGNGTLTPTEFVASMFSEIGSEVRDIGQTQENLELVGQRLEAERQSVSGVDANEELARLVQFQRSFQMAAQYISVVNQTLADLVNIIR